MRSVVEIGASVPAFLGKLWKLVNDTETNHLISWSPGGKTFVIKNQADFARELLPLYYKHNNMASFIRQLNMYGFHKITSVENGGLRYERDEIEFSHPCFMRGHAYLLEHIKRKIANPKSIITSSESGEKLLVKPELMNKVLSDVKQMKGKQESLDAKFSAMKQENEALWREVAILRQKHIKQQQIVNNLIQFLMSLVQPARAPNASTNNVGVKRPYQLMINSAAHVSSSDSAYPGRIKNIKLDKDPLEEINEDNPEDGPTIHELAHDDILHNEASQDSMPVANYVTVEVNPSPGGTSQSPTDVNGMQYHVTLEDGEDNDGARIVYPICRTNGQTLQTESLPIVTSPSPTGLSEILLTPLNQCSNEQINNNQINAPVAQVAAQNKRSAPKKTITLNNKTLLSPNSYNTINPPTDLRLPADIFASDDSVSDTGVQPTDDPLNVAQDLSTEQIVSGTRDKMLGGINIKLEKQNDHKAKKTKKSDKNLLSDIKISNIKTEMQDDYDWNNMSLATLNNSELNRFDSLSRRDYNSKSVEAIPGLYGTNSNNGEVDDHLDAMQTDLDSLRELLRSDNYSLDTNTLMGLFGSDDPFYGLSYNPTDDRAKTSNAAEGNELISYTGNIPDFEDMSMPELENENSQDANLQKSQNDSVLNTPQVGASPAPFDLRH